MTVSSLRAAAFTAGLVITSLAGAQQLPTPAPLSITYKCVDAKGKTTYGNIGDAAGCKRLGAVDVPADPPAPVSAKAARATSSADTGERRHLLEDELRDKKAELEALQKDFNGGQPERQGGEKNNQRYLDRIERMKSEIVRLQGDIETLTSRLNRQGS